jgi:hypothetical protein
MMISGADNPGPFYALPNEVGMDWTAFVKSDGGSSGDREMGLKRIVTCLEAILSASH